MFESILEGTFVVLAVCAALSALGVGITSMYYGGNQMSRIGAVHEAPYEECEEAKRMLLKWIMDEFDNQGRVENDTDAGCSSPYVMTESREITMLVKKVHENGGRLVLRKQADHDIECAANTGLEVRKQLSEMDIRRAKNIEYTGRR